MPFDLGSLKRVPLFWVLVRAYWCHGEEEVCTNELVAGNSDVWANE